MTPVNTTKTVTTAATRVQVSTSHILVTSVYFEALKTNTGVIYVGLSDVSGTVHMSALSAGEGMNISVDQVAKHTSQTMLDLYSFWVDSSVSGEKVQVSYLRNL